MLNSSAILNAFHNNWMIWRRTWCLRKNAPVPVLQHAFGLPSEVEICQTGGMQTDTQQRGALLPFLPQGDSADDPDSVMYGFLQSISARNVDLYPAQEEALLEIFAGKHVVLNTPTGSGKSLVAVGAHFLALSQGKRSFYTSPIKALVSEKFFALCHDFGAHNVGMLTGDASINRDAPIICCTAEILAKLALGYDAKNQHHQAIDHVIMDEFHYYADRDRGAAWQIPLLTLKNTTFLLMSATMGDTPQVLESMRTMTGKDVAVVRSHDRPVPLDFTYSEKPIHETLEDLVRGKKSPVYVVNFSQRECVEEAQNALSVDFCSKEEKQAIVRALYGFRFDSPFGKDIRRFVTHGIGLHHAGLLPKYRLLVEKLSQQGLLKIIMGTDTLGVGVNVPIRTVLFTKLCKFDGERVGILSVRDFKQIAGRAGRKGFDDEGSVVCQAPEHVIENKRMEMRTDDPKKKRKLVKKKPPTKNYVAWDDKTFEKLISSPSEALVSSFDVNHGLILTLLQNTSGDGQNNRGAGYATLITLIARCHETPRSKSRLRRRAAVLLRALRHAGIVSVVRNTERGARLVINGALQHDFSLHHTLSLFLMDALPLLDTQQESYAVDVLSLVEAILEHPHVVLHKQIDKLKGERLAALKSEGMEYHDRLEELDKIEHPKPNRDFIYTAFNQFAEKHPWVGEDNIMPKSVVREMFELGASFHDYVREYGLQRSEGVLLRYVSQVYKALIQNVPAAFRTEALDEIIVYVRSLLERVDSSLLEEWSQLLQPPAEGVDAPSHTRTDTTAHAAHPIMLDPGAHARQFANRLRAEMHALVRAIAVGDLELVTSMVRVRDGEEPWTLERFKQALAPYFAEYQTILTTPESRKPHLTQITAVDEQTWRIQQVLVDPAGDNQWMVEATLVRDVVFNPGDPILYLERIGI